MELRHLRYFVLVAEELHFGRAAGRAGIAQPPLSQQIRSLEAELGVELFYRTKRQVRLTDAGQALLPRARRLLSDADNAAQTARDGARGLVGNLRIGFVGSLAFGFITEFVGRHREEVPDVTLTLCELTSEQQRQALHDERIDIGLMRYPVRESGLLSTPLSQEALVAAIPETHELASTNAPIPVSTLRNSTFVIFPRHYGPAFYDQVISLCHDAGFSPDIGQEAIQMPTIVSLVSAGVGVAIVPESMARMGIPGVVYREIRTADGSRSHASVYLVRREGDSSEIVERAFHLAQSVGEDINRPD